MGQEYRHGKHCERDKDELHVTFDLGDKSSIATFVTEFIGAMNKIGDALKKSAGQDLKPVHEKLDRILALLEVGPEAEALRARLDAARSPLKTAVDAND